MAAPKGAASLTYTPELGLRLAEVVKEIGGVGAAARLVEVKGEQVTKWIRGDAKAPFYALAMFASESGSSLDWLATGAEPKKRGDGVKSALTGTQRANRGERPEFIYVPRYEVTVSAGPGAVVGDENVRDYLAFREDFVRRELGVDPKDVFSFDAVGDSMKPTIEHGDTLTFVRFKDAVPAEGIFAIGIGETLQVKRLQPMVGGLMILSDNTAYKSATLGPAEAREVRILGMLKVISRVV